MKWFPGILSAVLLGLGALPLSSSVQGRPPSLGGHKPSAVSPMPSTRTNPISRVNPMSAKPVPSVNPFHGSHQQSAYKPGNHQAGVHKPGIHKPGIHHPGIHKPVSRPLTHMVRSKALTSAHHHGFTHHKVHSHYHCKMYWHPHHHCWYYWHPYYCYYIPVEYIYIYPPVYVEVLPEGGLIGSCP